MDHAKLDVRLISRNDANLAVITIRPRTSPVLYLGCGNKLKTHPCSGPGFSVSRRWTHVAGMGTVVCLAAVTLISLSCTCCPTHQESWDKMVGGAASAAHTLHPAHLHALSIAPFCLAAISTPIPLRLHDPHCLTARLESLGTTYTIPSCPPSNICPNLLTAACYSTSQPHSDCLYIRHNPPSLFLSISLPLALASSSQVVSSAL